MDCGGKQFGVLQLEEVLCFEVVGNVYDQDMGDYDFQFEVKYCQQCYVCDVKQCGDVEYCVLVDFVVKGYEDCEN